MNTSAPRTAAESEDKTFPYPRQCPFTPPEEYAHLAEENLSQVTLDGSGLRIWTITGYETIRELLTDPRVSASRKHANFPFYFVAPPEFRTETSFIGYDGQEHTSTRRKAALTFTHRQVQRLRPRIEEIVDEHIDRMLTMPPPVDMHRVFSLAVPMTVICELLGIPQDQHDFFIKHGTALLGGHSGPEERQAAIVEVNAYVEELIRLKQREPGDDLLSRAMADYEASGEEYTDRDLFNMVRLLMNGGHETTASQISLGTACLLENPDQLEQLRNDPSLVKPAVEELVRIATIGDTAIPRVALEDIEIGGKLIRKGDGILCLGLAGNRDPGVFPEPDRLIISRGSRKHLGFGHGVHHCIGADLARLELEIVWSKLFERIPTLRLAKPFLEIPRKEGAVIYGLWELPVTWDEAGDRAAERTVQKVDAELYVEVQQFYARQMPLLEERKLEEFLETFTEDCTLEHVPFGWRFEGREQLLKEMSARRGDASRPRVEETSARRAREENIAYYDGLVYRYWFDRMLITPVNGDILRVRYQAIVSMTDASGKVSFEPTTVVEDELVRCDGELRTRARVVTHDSANWADKVHNPS